MTQNIRIEVLAGCFISSKALAELFGVSPDMVRKYVNDYGMPRVGNGKYLLGDCVQWYINRLRLQADGVETSDIAAEKLRLVRAQRQRVELDNKHKRGELLAAEDVSIAINQMAGISAPQLDGLAARTAALVAGLDDPGQVQRVLFDECRHIRESTAAAATAVADVYDGGVDTAAPKVKKRRAVGRRKSSTAKRKPRARAVANG